MFCKNCGNEIKNGVRSCDKCGAAASSEQNITTDSANKGPPESTASKSLFLVFYCRASVVLLWHRIALGQYRMIFVRCCLRNPCDNFRRIGN